MFIAWEQEITVADNRTTIIILRCYMYLFLNYPMFVAIFLNPKAVLAVQRNQEQLTILFLLNFASVKGVHIVDETVLCF
jgi:hypothetical protein